MVEVAGLAPKPKAPKGREQRTEMADLEAKTVETPDETRSFDRGKVDVVNVTGLTIGRFTLEPGWKWSECVKPIVGGDSCQSLHTGYVVSGRLRIRMDDGTESEFGPGDVYRIGPGHDGWVLGDDAYVGLDFTGAADYAKH
jgi:hypothetical protein